MAVYALMLIMLLTITVIAWVAFIKLVNRKESESA